ncbi:hypothetical protein SCHPADRAFT_840483, partial [Schizopora paradoxa]
KIKPRYLGPYIVVRQTKGESYVVRELSGAVSRRGIAAFRLIPYVRRTADLSDLSIPPNPPVNSESNSDASISTQSNTDSDSDSD